MSTMDLNDGPPVARPKSLSASSLLGRAAFGLVVLFVGTFVSAWLYDTTIKANASTAATMEAQSDPTARASLPTDPISTLHNRAAAGR